VEAARTLSSSLGTIRISSEAVAQIVGRTTAECYGIVGMAPRPGLARGRVGKLLSRDKLTQGIVVAGEDGGLRIDVHVVVEYGLNLGEVGAALRSRVAYEVERLSGLRVAAVEVHIEDVRRSA
jgi:uncharacterized alkaline shock family protein YloU